MTEETLHELHKSTIKSFIEKRRKQAEIAAAHSQTAKKAYLGNSRETGWRDPIVPRVVGQIGKIGQHNDALLQTAAIFNQRYERAKASADKATLRLLRKPAATMKNEEVVTEGKWLNRLRAATIVTGATVLGAGLGGLKHATLKNNEQQGGRQVHGSSNTFVGAGAGAGLAAGVGANEVVGGGATLAAMLARRRAKRNEEYTSLTGIELQELKLPKGGLDPYRGSGIVQTIRRRIAIGGNIMRSEPRRGDFVQRHALKVGAIGGGAMTATNLLSPDPHPGAIVAGAVGGAGLLGGMRLIDKWKANRAKSKEQIQKEEYTQVLEQIILSLTGIELGELHETVGGLTGATPKRANAVLNRRLGQYKEKKKIGDVKGAEKAYARWDRTATLVNRRERWPMPVPAALKNRNYWNL